jgi:hypothetical protein
LSCSQKHKQRASCNGIRDPAEYLKKSQLATPAGIDRDYNYLKSVERSVDVAHRDTRERGIGTFTRDASKSVARARHPDSILQKYLVANNIHVLRAPKGMSRQKTNLTRATKRNHIVWTIEWVDAAGEINLSNSCEEWLTISTLYRQFRTEKHNALKRKAGEGWKDRSKRKRHEAPEQGSSQHSIIQDISGNDGSRRATGVEHNEETLTYPDSGNIMPPAVDDGAPSASTDPDPQPEAETSDLNRLHFYLLLPGTSSSAKVLIKLDPQATLTTSLRNRIVLEYPTIHVLPHDPASLPEGYITEDQYSKVRQSEEDELKDAMAKADTEGILSQVGKPEPGSTSVSASNIDPQTILDMLKRDVTR